MPKILDTLTAFFQEQGWPLLKLENETVLQTSFQGDNGKWTCYARTLEENGQFVFYSVCPVNVPAEKRSAMAELTTRANYGLVVGNWEMDFDDGEVRYKTSAGFEEETPPPALLRHLVYVNVLTTDKYLPVLLKMIYSDVSPEAALAELED